MRKFFKPLSRGQQWGVYFAAIVYGLLIVVLSRALSPSLFAELDHTGSLVAAAILFVAWLVGVIAIRLYSQDKDPTDFKSLMGISQSRKKR